VLDTHAGHYYFRASHSSGSEIISGCQIQAKIDTHSIKSAFTVSAATCSEITQG
jgi:hypothetical protein